MDLPPLPRRDQVPKVFARREARPRGAALVLDHRGLLLARHRGSVRWCLLVRVDDSLGVARLEHGADADAQEQPDQDAEAGVEAQVMQGDALAGEALHRLGDDVQEGGRQERARREGEGVRQVDAVRHLLVHHHHEPRKAAEDAREKEARR